MLEYVIRYNNMEKDKQSIYDGCWFATHMFGILAECACCTLKNEQLFQTSFGYLSFILVHQFYGS